MTGADITARIERARELAEFQADATQWLFMAVALLCVFVVFAAATTFRGRH